MSQEKKLKFAPLVEALFEIKWVLKSTDQGGLIDPGFDVALLRFSECVKTRFKHVQPLDSLKIPKDMAPYLVRYRYRVEEDKWPLVQLGPGVASLNFTEPYDWDSFLTEARHLVPCILGAYEGFDLTLSSLLLRYINAEPFDFEEYDVLEFLATKLNTRFRPPVSEMASHPERIKECNWFLQYQLPEPCETGELRIATGMRGGERNIIWELNVRSTNQVPQPDGTQNKAIIEWLHLAHKVIEEWFFEIIDGDLLRKYQGGE